MVGFPTHTLKKIRLNVLTLKTQLKIQPKTHVHLVPVLQNQILGKKIKPREVQSSQTP